MRSVKHAISRLMTSGLIVTSLMAGSGFRALAADAPRTEQPMAVSPLLPAGGVIRKVQRELLTLPGYTVFDYLTCKQLEDGSVMLTGQVVNASLKRKAEAAAAAVAGPVHIVNRIEVLPASAQDQDLRSKLYRELYGDQSMTSYAVRRLAPIHIVVKNGQISLEGVVDAGVDRTLAESTMHLAAAGPVTNHLLASEDSNFAILSSR